MKSYTTLRNLATTLSTNTSSTNATLFDQLINDSHRRYLEKYFFNEASFTINTVSQQQAYDLPFNYSKLKTGTLTIGALKWNPREILTRDEWDSLNVIPYFADIPNNFFIWNNSKFALYPIPSTTGNVITFNYKKRVPDLTFADYGTTQTTLGVNTTASATLNSATITGANGTGTCSWLANYLPSAGSVLNLNLWLKISSPKGDDNWYQISSIESATSLTLVNTYQGGTTTGASYTIGQMPLLLEDFHDVLVFDSLVTYFTTIVDNKGKADEFRVRRNEITDMMEHYSGSKTINVNLARPRIGQNPNLYTSNIG